VLTASYAGLVLGPALIAAVAHFSSLADAYAALAVLTLLASALLLRGSSP
jgi:hypothetical protein